MLGLSRIGAALVLAAAATTNGNGNNGNGAGATAASAPGRVPAYAFRQQSFSGTSRGHDGATTPDDYAREMADPVSRMRIFEEMRSDDAVNTAIDARRQEINAANWVLSTEDKSARAAEVLEFVEDNVYPHLDKLLRLLGGGGIHYGFGLVEPVYAWADRPPVGLITRGATRRAAKTQGRRIYLEKLAHVRQTAVASFKIDRQGDLTAVRQELFDGTEFRRTDLPPEKLLLWTYDQQGDDCWGVPPTRHCWKAWHYKTQIERLSLLHADKFGVGVPTVEEGQGWSQAERERLAEYLRALRAGSDNFVVYPAGGKFEIRTDDGRMMLSSLEFLKYYNVVIAATYLTQHSQLGTTETGSRAVGETIFEQMAGIVQADCEDLASIINNRLIVPLVLWNFGPQDAYPAFAPTQRVHRAGGAAAAALAQLAGIKAIHFRAEDEVHLRDVFGLPTVELATLQREQKDRDALAQAAQEAASEAKRNGDGPDGGARDERAPGSERDKPPLRVAARALDAPALATLATLATLRQRQGEAIRSLTSAGASFLGAAIAVGMSEEEAEKMLRRDTDDADVSP